MTFQLASLVGLFCLQAGNWQKTIGSTLRFILCGFFTFLAFSIYELLKGVTFERQNSLIVAAFGEPNLWVLIFYLVFLGYIGLYFSIIAAALFASLLPKT